MTAKLLFAAALPAGKTAQQACKKLNPVNGLNLTASGDSREVAMLQYARCMRAHDVPNYPDPPTGNAARLASPDLSSLGINMESPAFTSAAKACSGQGIPAGMG